MPESAAQAARKPGSPGLAERPPQVERQPGAVASHLLQAAQARPRLRARVVAAWARQRVVAAARALEARARPRVEAAARALEAPPRLRRLACPTPEESKAPAARARSGGRRTRPVTRTFYCWGWSLSHSGRRGVATARSEREHSCLRSQAGNHDGEVAGQVAPDDRIRRVPGLVRLKRLARGRGDVFV
jgi:hypothetical protein